MSQNGFSPKLVAGIIVALFFSVALYLRVVLPYDQVFVGDWIKFTGNDAYYHMRIVDNLVHNFPHLNLFDPYMIYPGGSRVVGFAFFNYLLASIIWLIGLGSPTQHTVDVVGVYFPAVLGALTVIPVYFIGKALFNRWAGVIAAGLVAIFPGEFLGRSILGFTDYHVAETLFTTIAMLFFILAIKAGRDRGITFDCLWHRQWATIAKPLIYSLFAGIFVGVYFLTWAGALLFVFIVFVYFLVQFIIDHLRSRSTDYLCFVGVTAFTIALLMFLPTSADRMSLASLVIAIFISIALAGLSRLMASRGLKPIFYPLAILGFGLASLAVFQIISPSLLKSMVGSLGIFVWPMETTILEMRPFLFFGDNFSWMIAWSNFTTGFFISFISLGILIYFIIKRGEADKTLFIVWSLVMLAATLSMRRFAYYFVVNVALLTGYFSWLILQFAGLREPAAAPVQAVEKAKKKAKRRQSRQGGFRLTASRGNLALGVVVVLFLVFYPNIGPMPKIGPLPTGTKLAIETASRAQFAPSDGWCESLSWLKDNTPDPFGDPDFYYELYEPPVPGESYNYPETAYSVTAWWDYGYLISRLGHRIPNAHPGGGYLDIFPQFFVAQDEASANKLIENWDSKYVIVDYDIAVVTLYASKFHAVATLSGSSKEEFYELYGYRQDGQLVPVMLFYPEYYRSLIVRLYNFDGREVDPQRTTVISYEDRISGDGKPYKLITSVESLPSYEEAEAYVSSQVSGNYRIVSENPFVTPVPLEAMEHYELVYSSASSKMEPGGSIVPEVKIFEYVR